jgi:hypothetical protein
MFFFLKLNIYVKKQLVVVWWSPHYVANNDTNSFDIELECCIIIKLAMA